MNEAPPDLKSSTVAYTGRIFTVTVDQVAYSDGRVVKMEVVRHPGSVVLMPMTAPDRILLVQQYRYVVNQWLWELPAGTREPGESIDDAARRECHEEVAKIAGRAERLFSFFPSPGFCDEEMHFFRLTDLRDRRAGEPAAQQDPDELLRVGEFSLKEVDGMIRAGQISDMKTALGVALLGVRGKG